MHFSRQKEILSTLWIFVTLNYLYCDVAGLMDAHLLRQYLNGQVEGMIIDETFLLYAGMLMELPIAMVLLCRVLPHKAGCIANIVAGFIKTAVMTATLFVGSVSKYYLFFAVIEISTTLFIISYAAYWLKQKAFS